jgi:RNA-directed DNA polymerase
MRQMAGIHNTGFIERIAAPDNLNEAWIHVSRGRQKGSRDWLEVRRIRQQGVNQLLEGIQTDLLEGTYRPLPVRRKSLEKSPGKYRKLGIPTIRDRITQYAVVRQIEGRLDRTFSRDSFGFRTGRTARDAVLALEHEISSGKGHIVKVDLESYFDTIPYSRLLDFLDHELMDEDVSELVNRFLHAGVLVNGEWEPSIAGAPQGGPLSPILSNVYLNQFDQFWLRQEGELGRLVRYADDLVIVCSNHNQAVNAHRIATTILESLDLKVNATKTKLVELGEHRDSLDFLGFHHYGQPQNNGRLKVIREPSNKAIQRLKVRIRESIETTRHAEIAVQRIHQAFRDWWNYYKIATGGKHGPRMESTINSIRLDAAKHLAPLVGSQSRAKQMLKARRALHP